MNIALSPQLLMLSDNCFYCNETHVRSFEIRHNYGIKACFRCDRYAIRDINAFMHREGIIPVDYAIEHHKLKEFTNMISEVFHVRRTNGIIEIGWTLDTGSKINRKFFVYDVASNTWLIPVKKNNLTKSISIHEIMHNFPSDTNKIKNIIKLMNAGIYINDARQHDSLVNIGASLTVEDYVL